MIGLMNADQRLLEAARILKASLPVFLIEDVNEELPHLEAVVFPMSGVKNGKVKLNGEWVELSEHFWQQLPQDCLLISATVNEEMRAMDRSWIDLSENESFIQNNSRLTAEGVLFLLLDNTTCGLADCHVDLLGYGHCGKEIYDLLTALDVKVRVVRREVKHESEQFISLDTWRKLPVNEIVINTSITNWIDEASVKRWEKAPLILNIVSAYRLPESKIMAKGGRVVNAGVLPALIAWKSAGEQLAACVKGVLTNGK